MMMIAMHRLSRSSSFMRAMISVAMHHAPTDAPPESIAGQGIQEVSTNHAQSSSMHRDA
jgi:hypothetical protein